MMAGSPETPYDKLLRWGIRAMYGKVRVWAASKSSAVRYGVDQVCHHPPPTAVQHCIQGFHRKAEGFMWNQVLTHIKVGGLSMNVLLVWQLPASNGQALKARAPAQAKQAPPERPKERTPGQQAEQAPGRSSHVSMVRSQTVGCSYDKGNADPLARASTCLAAKGSPRAQEPQVRKHGHQAG
eukprot:1161897-Pelagomonas_calceolata.AAC.3